MQYIPNTKEAEHIILESLGVERFEELLSHIPRKFLDKCKIELPEPMSETEIIQHVKKIAAKNDSTSDYISFLGGGSYDHFVPTVIDFLIQRSEFYTAYTPYQPEVSQGTLQSIYEYQSMICQLMDMEVANASLYDGATALAEAAIMATHVTRQDKVLVSSLINPSAFQVLKTYLDNRGIEIDLLPSQEGLTDLSQIEARLDGTAGVIIQTPNFLGNIALLSNLKQSLADKNTLLIIMSDPISNSILKTPGELGADIAVAEGQPLGIHQAFGGPYLGVFGARRSLIRKMPGRIVGQTRDVDGKRGYVLVLQTREQHIRRERATSNICTNQGLMALAATIYLALLGKKGLQQVADLCLQKSHHLAKEIAKLPGFERVYPNAHFFKELTIKTPVKADKIVAAALEEQTFAGLDLGQYQPEWNQHLLVAVTEKRTSKEINDFIKFLTKFS